jgi:hypothetical protein
MFRSGKTADVGVAEPAVAAGTWTAGVASTIAARRSCEHVLETAAVETCCQMLDAMVAGFSWGCWRLAALMMPLMKVRASERKAPKVSATIGRNSHPLFLQASWYFLYFACAAASRVVPAESPSRRLYCLMDGVTTVKSTARG